MPRASPARRKEPFVNISKSIFRVLAFLLTLLLLACSGQPANPGAPGSQVAVERPPTSVCQINWRIAGQKIESLSQAVYPKVYTVKAEITY